MMRVADFKKSDIIVLIYYALLLVLFLSWQNSTSVPVETLRIAYMTAVFAPILIVNERRWLPAIVIVFNSLACFGYTSSYMPTMWYTYAVFILLVFVVTKRDFTFSRERSTVITYLAALLIVSFFVDLISNGKLTESASALLIIILIATTINYESSYVFQLLSFSFIVISLALSLQYLMMRVTFTEFHMMGDMVREGFNDINYSACVMSLGIMACLFQIFSGRIKGKLWRSALIYGTIVLSMISLAQNASRASFFSIAVCFAVLMLSSKTKLWVKILVVASVFALLLFMEQAGYFELFKYRMQNDEISGGRFNYWTHKLGGFAERGPFTWIFGLGLQGGREIGGINDSTHNDFVSYLLYYGFIGFSLFIAFFSYPFRKAERQNKLFVAAGTLGLFVIAFTLEPFAKGMIPYYGFWLYLLSLAKQPNIES